MNLWESDALYPTKWVNYSPEEYGKLLQGIHQKECWCSIDTDYDPDENGSEGKRMFEALKMENKK